MTAEELYLKIAETAAKAYEEDGDFEHPPTMVVVPAIGPKVVACRLDNDIQSAADLRRIFRIQESLITEHSNLMELIAFVYEAYAAETDAPSPDFDPETAPGRYEVLIFSIMDSDQQAVIFARIERDKEHDTAKLDIPPFEWNGTRMLKIPASNMLRGNRTLH